MTCRISSFVVLENSASEGKAEYLMCSVGVVVGENVRFVQFSHQKKFPESLTLREEVAGVLRGLNHYEKMLWSLGGSRAEISSFLLQEVV